MFFQEDATASCSYKFDCLIQHIFYASLWGLVSEIWINSSRGICKDALVLMATPGAFLIVAVTDPILGGLPLWIYWSPRNEQICQTAVIVNSDHLRHQAIKLALWQQAVNRILQFQKLTLTTLYFRCNVCTRSLSHLTACVLGVSISCNIGIQSLVQFKRHCF